MDYISTQEASEKWGISTTRITILAKEGRIPGAQRFGKNWLIPADAVKPPKRKGGRGRPPKPELDHFSFPLYPYRPDWSEAKEKQLSPQQKRLLAAETAFLECRYEEAYRTTETVLAEPEDICTEIAALWNAGMCCIALNRSDDFSRIYLRLQQLLAKDFPRRDDMAVVLDILKTYVQTIDSAANCKAYIEDVHKQVLPLATVLLGYFQLAKEISKSRSVDPSLLEIILAFQEDKKAAFITEMLHICLMGIYSLRQQTELAEYHVKAAVQLAYESKVYFPLASYYQYNTTVFSSILEQYPEEFRTLCCELGEQYKKNYALFITAISNESVIAKLTDEDYPIAFEMLAGLSNARIAESLGVTQSVVNHKVSKLCKMMGVKNKKELIIYLRKFI